MNSKGANVLFDLKSKQQLLDAAAAAFFLTIWTRQTVIIIKHKSGKMLCVCFFSTSPTEIPIICSNS